MSSLEYNKLLFAWTKAPLNKTPTLPVNVSNLVTPVSWEYIHNSATDDLEQALNSLQGVLLKIDFRTGLSLVGTQTILATGSTCGFLKISIVWGKVSNFPKCQIESF